MKTSVAIVIVTIGILVTTVCHAHTKESVKVIKTSQMWKAFRPIFCIWPNEMFLFYQLFFHHQFRNRLGNLMCVVRKETCTVCIIPDCCSTRIGHLFRRYRNSIISLKGLFRKIIGCFSRNQFYLVEDFLPSNIENSGKILIIFKYVSDSLAEIDLKKVVVISRSLFNGSNNKAAAYQFDVIQKICWNHKKFERCEPKSRL